MNTKYKLYYETFDSGGIFSTKILKSKKEVLEFIKKFPKHEILGWSIKKIK